MSDAGTRGGRSTAGRIAMVVGGLALVVVAFVLLRGSGDDSSQPPAASPAETQASSTATAAPGSTPAAKATTTPAAAKAPTIRVRGGEPVGGVRTLTFKKGDTIRFRVVADAPDEAHFHGYDIEKPLVGGKPVTFQAKATFEGRFEVELHGSGAKIAEVEVGPS